MNDQNHGERLAVLEARQDRVEKDIHDIKETLDEFKETIFKGKGTWTAAVALMGLAGAIIVGILVNWVTGLIPDKGQ